MQTLEPDTPATKVIVSLFIIGDTGVITHRNEEGGTPLEVVLVYDKKDAESVLDRLLQDEVRTSDDSLTLREELQLTLDHADCELPALDVRTPVSIPDGLLDQFDEYLFAGLEELHESNGMKLGELFAGLIENQGVSLCWANTEEPEVDTCLLVLYAPSTRVTPTATLITSKAALQSLIDECANTSTKGHLQALQSFLPHLAKATGSSHLVHLNETLAQVLVIGERIIRRLIKNRGATPTLN